MTQQQLITACKANNKKAQIALYRQYQQGMYNIAYRLLQNTEDAEDVIQEAFLSAFKHIHQFKGEVTFGAWLKKIVINKSINVLKKSQLKFVDMEVYEETGVTSVSNSATIHETQVKHDVKVAIGKLSERYRFVVLLYLIEGFDHAEISQVLDISVTASKTRLMRGKQKLRHLLKAKGYGDRF